MNSVYRLLGAILLVSGTTIGAGMLALPVVTGFAGFIPATILFVFYWVFMTFTALLMLEVNLWMGEHTNLITMARHTLGNGGKFVSWVIYLFLLYTLTTAYIAGSGPIFLDFIQQVTGYTLPTWFGPFPLLLLFGLFVYQGARAVDYANRILMIGLAFTFVLMIIFLTPEVKSSLLTHTQWCSVWIAVSIVSTSFGFHIIIPTLTDYLKRDVVQIRKVILIGSAIPLVVYIIWNFLALGIIPTEELTHGYQNGLDGATILSHLLGRSDLSLVARFFSLFAIITSFLGVSLSLRDFLSDGLNIPKTHKGKAMLYLLTFVPPLLLALTDPRAFLDALEYAGAFGVVTLLAILPILMVWQGRYAQQRTGPFTTPGGKGALIVAMMISLSVIGIEIAYKTGLIYRS